MNTFNGNNSSPEWSEPNVEAYFREVVKTPLLPTIEAEQELIKRIRAGDPKAREEMIKSNLLLVAKIAGDFTGFGLPLLDLIQEGNIGLMKSIERFDPNKGGKLSTYASWWIKQSIKRALSNQSRDIRIPVHMVDKINKVRRIAHALSEEYGRYPTPQEISDLTGISRKKIAHILELSRRPISLSEVMNDQGGGDGEGDKAIGREYSFEFVDEAVVSPFDKLVTEDMLGKVNALLDILDPREREVIIARFGLFGRKREVLQEVGASLERTRERARQIENIALRKMRRRLIKLEDSRYANAARNLTPATPSQSDPRKLVPVLSPEAVENIANMDIQVSEQFGFYREQLQFLLNIFKKYPDTTPNNFAERAGVEGERVLGGKRTAGFFLDSKNLLVKIMHAYMINPETALNVVPWYHKPILSLKEQKKVMLLKKREITIDRSIISTWGEQHLVQQMIDILAHNPGITMRNLLGTYDVYNGNRRLHTATDLNPSTKVMLYIHSFLAQ